MFGKFGKDASAWKGGKKLSSMRSNMKRGHFGFEPLNDSFPGCEGHHITKSLVIHIPKELHRSIWHNQNTRRGMIEINTLAIKFLEGDFK